MVPILRKFGVLSVISALVISLLPLYSFGNEKSDYLNTETKQLSTSIPTESQLDNAVENQLIVTYADDSLSINESVNVASLDGAPLEEVASNLPVEETTLASLGAIKSELITEQDDDCAISASSLITFEEGKNVQEISAQLLSSSEIVSVQPNYKYELFSIGSTNYHDATSTKAARHATNDPYSLVNESERLNQSYLYSTKIADAWDAGYRTNGSVTIAVIDAGPRLDHPDLNSVWDLEHARDFTNTTSADGLSYSDSSSYWEGKTGYECHGTWVSGVLGATANNRIGIAGTSYNAKVLPIKVTNGKTLYTSTIVKAYNYLDKLVESGKLPTLKVINLSLGGREYDYSFDHVINHMSKSHNILTVAAAGNYGDKIAMYPADFKDVLSVMATDADFSRASFSNYGNKDVSAPGTDITTTIPYSYYWNNSNTYKYSKSGINGTSFSAPIVSGVAALCYAVKPKARFDEVKWAIKSGATSLASIDKTCAPYLNAIQAVKNVLNGMGLFEATHTSISSVKVSTISTKVYSGKSFTPSPKVTLNGKKLTRGIDYSLSFLNNKFPGEATITIRALGAYKGTKKVTFKIIPKATKIKNLKSKNGVIKVRWKSQKSNANGYQIKYSTSPKCYSSKKLRTGKTVKVIGKYRVSAALKPIKSKKRHYVQVRTFRRINGVDYYSKWSSVKKVMAK